MPLVVEICGCGLVLNVADVKLGVQGGGEGKGGLDQGLQAGFLRGPMTT